MTPTIHSFDIVTYIPTSNDPIVEQERRTTIESLLADHHFHWRSTNGGQEAYALTIVIEEDRVHLQIKHLHSPWSACVKVSVQPLSRFMKDYTLLCERYHDASHLGNPYQLEAIDMGRRSLHNEASEHLVEALAEQIDIDLATARKLFTLIYTFYQPLPIGK